MTTLTITSGKFYRTRKGHKARALAADHDLPFTVVGDYMHDGKWVTNHWTSDGRDSTMMETPCDLIAEWTEPETEPWTLTDVPFPCAILPILPNPTQQYCTVLSVLVDGVTTQNGFYEWTTLAKYWSYTTNGRDFAPCTKGGAK